MLPLGDKPVLEHIIDWLRRGGVTDIIISVGYLRRMIEDYFESGKEIGVKISYARTRRPMGTAGQLKAAESYVDDTFLCIYGDSLIEFDLAKAYRQHKNKKTTATITLLPYQTTLRYGFIELDGRNRVVGWDEKPKYQGLINVGCYIMEPRFLKYIPRGKMYGMDRAFKRAIQGKELIQGYTVDGDLIDIGDRKSYRSAYDKYLSRLGTIR